MYSLDEGVAWLFQAILHKPERAKLFVNTCDDNGKLATDMQHVNFIVSTICPQESAWLQWQKKLANKNYTNENNERCEVIHAPDLTMVNPTTAFHYAFSFMPGINVYDYSNDKVFPLETEDTLLQWSVSKESPNRHGPLAMMLMEQAAKAVLPGGYYGMVVPKKWSGRHMEFVMKWMEEMGAVVKIDLPAEAVYKNVTAEDGTVSKEFAPGIHCLLIFHKKYNETNVRKNTMEFASMRYRCFVTKLKSLSSGALEATWHRFNRSEWKRYSVKKYADYIKITSHGSYCCDDLHPIALQEVKDIRILKVAETNQLQFRVIEDLVSIGNNTSNIRVIPTELGVKLKAFSPEAISSLSVVRHKMGIDPTEQREATKSGRPAIGYFDEMIQKPLRECQHQLIQLLANNGLTPVMWLNDYKKMLRNRRWLSIQKAPVERTIRVPGEVEGQDEWEKIYDDVSIQAAFPEVYSLWEKRAKKMKIDGKAGPKQTWTYQFQFNDIVTMACKQSLINANQPGLGKTREVLFAAMLRGQEKLLIVCPVRLIGVWQQEIESTITNYARTIRKDWSGKPLRYDYRIIKNAKDCLPQNLAMFNIISYNDMARVPRDAVFFECLQCKFRICSPFARYLKKCEEQACPKCNKGIAQKDKQYNKDNNLRKYKDKDGRIIDNRISTGKIMMLPQEKQYPKIKETIVKTKEYNPNTLQYETKEEVMRSDRGLHLKWTFANILRNVFTMRAIDEGNNIANADTNRSIANDHCRSRSRYTMTGTPVKGYPQSIVGPLNFTHKASVFGEYRPVAGQARAGINKFIKKYVTFVHRDGKTAKAIPKISQPELFQQETSPLMIRHVRHEPIVAKSIPPRTPELRPLRIDMDPEHRAFYNKWLEKFAEWWQLKRIEVDKKDAKLTNDLLVKLGYLVNASNIPHAMSDNLGSEDGKNWATLIGPYTGPPVAKMFKCMELLKKYSAQGDKTIIGCWRKANVKFGRSWCLDHNKKNPGNLIYPIQITGDDSNEIQQSTNRSKKQEIINKFCSQDYHALWSTIETLKEGFNIPEANHAIMLELTWQPSDTEQFIGRMLRPGQTKEVIADFLVHKGTVDEYITAINFLKRRSAEEGVDYQAFDDITSDMIPDFIQYANSIVDGTEGTDRTKMWLAVEELHKRLEDLDEDGPINLKED